VLENLEATGFLNSHQVSSLRELRWLKAAYRGGLRVPYPKVSELLQQAVCCAPIEVLSTCCMPTLPSEIIFKLQKQPEAATPYHRLRYLEKMYVSLAEMDIGLCNDQKINCLKRWIEDPRSYVFYAEANEEAILEFVLSAADRPKLKLHDELICAA
jgi:hypothetical protein